MIIHKIVNYIKSVFFCMHFFGIFTALKAPIYIGGKVKFTKTKSSKIIINGDIRRHMISINLVNDSEGVLVSDKFEIILGSNTTLTIGENCVFSKGGSIRLDDSSAVSIGKNCFFNKRLFIYSAQMISIGEGCIFGWNCQLRDNDGHHIYFDNCQSQMTKKISIDDNCWIGSDNVILKGANLPRGSVLASNSLLNKNMFKDNSLYAGIPARLIKENVHWEK